MTAGQPRAGVPPIVFQPAPAVGWMSELTLVAAAAFGLWGLRLVEEKLQLPREDAPLLLGGLLPLCLVPSPPRSLSASLRRYAEQYPLPHVVAPATALHAALYPVVSTRCQPWPGGRLYSIVPLE